MYNRDRDKKSDASVYMRHWKVFSMTQQHLVNKLSISVAEVMVITLVGRFIMLSNPFSPPCEKYDAHQIFTWKMSILNYVTNRYVLEIISSRILTDFRLMLCCETTRYASGCFAWTCYANWHEMHYNSYRHHRVGVVKSLASVCTLKQNTEGTSRGLTNIKSNRNKSRSD